jgi:dihydroorotase
MSKFYIFFASILLPIALLGQNKPYTIIIKGGHVIDPKNSINSVMDIAIANGKIAKIAARIDPSQADQVVNASGMYVTPGLIDLHGHVFAGTQPDQMYSNGFNSIMPDGFYQRMGVTTVVDAGGSGWRDFPIFKKNIIDNSQTRVLSFLNIVGNGMRGGAVEQNVDDMDPAKIGKIPSAQLLSGLQNVSSSFYSTKVNVR